MANDDLHPDVQLRLDQMPMSYRNTYLKAVERKSRAMAIKAMCLECTGYDRKAVTACTSPGCPLYAYRPYQVKEE